MSSLKITLPDGSVKEFPQGVTGMEIAKSISEGLMRNALSIEVNGEIWDLNRAISKDSSIKIFTWNDKGGKYAFWHSSAHLFAEALEALYPGTKFGIGPPIENGFYYDVDLGDTPFGDEELVAVEKKMLELAKLNNAFVRSDVSKKEALDYLALNANVPEALPSLIFLDLDMPVMNGFDFLQQFKEYAEEVKQGCRIVVITASDVIADIEKMKSDPHVIKLIAKPLHRHSLVL